MYFALRLNYKDYVVNKKKVFFNIPIFMYLFQFKKLLK